MKSKKKSGTGILTAALPIARAVLPFLGRSAASGAIGFGTSSLIGKIFGSKIKRRKGRRKFNRKTKRLIYRRFVK